MGDRRYRLYAKIDGRWASQADVTAPTHREAFRKAMLALRPEHYDKPIRLEQVAAATRKKTVRRGGRHARTLPAPRPPKNLA